MTDSDGKTIKNTSRSWMMILASIVLLFSVIIGYHIMNHGGWAVYVAIFMYATGVIAFLALFYRMVYNLPKEIAFDDDGFTFVFPFSRRKHYQWQDIRCAYDEQGLDSGSILIDGTVSPIFINNEILSNIRSNYTNNVGKHPLTMEEYNIIKRYKSVSNGFPRRRFITDDQRTANDTGPQTDNGKPYETKCSMEIRGISEPNLRLSAIALRSLGIIFLLFLVIMVLIYGTWVITQLASIMDILVAASILIASEGLTHENRRNSSSIIMDGCRMKLKNDWIDMLYDVRESVPYDEIEYVSIIHMPGAEGSEPRLMVIHGTDGTQINSGKKDAEGLREAVGFLASKGVRVEEHR